MGKYAGRFLSVFSMALTFAVVACSGESRTDGVSASENSQGMGKLTAEETSPVAESAKPNSEPCVDQLGDDALAKIFREKICKSVNAVRAENGLGPLALSTRLSSLAQNHAVDMVDSGYFSHTSLDGLSPFDRMNSAGVAFRSAGENIATGQKTPDQVMNSWLASRGHRENILNSKFAKLGVGYEQHMWVQEFTD